MTRHEKLTKDLEKLCEAFENAHYPEDQREQHPEWTAWIDLACGNMTTIQLHSPTCPPSCGPPD